jgi:4-hydroxybenzoate polyprenyltransferase
MTTNYLKALRPEQWSKNLVVFAGLIFARKTSDSEILIQSILAFILFCLASSAVYIINDIIDIKKDRQHPEKSQRPIASGKIKKSYALTLSIFLMIISFAGSALLINEYFLTAIFSYIVLIILYSFSLKKVVIIDVMTIAAGFVIRAVGGAVAIMVEISPWLIVCTTLLALFIGFGKRRQEIVLLEGNATNHRKTLDNYSISFLDQLIAIVTSATIVAYAIYTFFGDMAGKYGVKHLELTIPFVIYGIFRYLFLIHKREQGGSPTRILYTDIPILICVVLWISSILLLTYSP